MMLRPLCCALAVLLLLTAVCRAGSYKWTDRDGTLHFSDTLPAGDVPRARLDVTDAGERPLLPKPLLVYQDRVFRIMLVKETEDLVEFELTYSDIQHTYPGVISGAARLFICATDEQRSSTYLAYTVAPVEGGSKTVTLSNRLSRHSPESLETAALHLLLNNNDRQKNDYRNLFSVDIPFRKLWQKQRGVVYQ